jgi:hypothetical protein
LERLTVAIAAERYSAIDLEPATLKTLKVVFGKLWPTFHVHSGLPLGNETEQKRKLLIWFSFHVTDGLSGMQIEFLI